jgi:tetratricopeptide (TPR) repeat protein
VDSDTQSRLALENLQQQSTQNTNIAYFTVGLFGLVKPDELGRPISIVKFLEAAERDLQSGKVETLEGKTTFLICVAMAFDRVGEVAKADRMLAAAEETLTTTITHDFSSAPYIKGYLIRAFLQQKKPEKAIFWLKDALSNLEKDKRLVTQLGFGFLEQLADAALAVNRPKDAIPWLEKTLAIQQATPAEAKRDTSGLRRQLARLYKADGRADGDRNR